MSTTSATSATPATAATAATAAEQNMEVFRRVIEDGFNGANIDALNNYMTPTFTEHQFDLPPTVEGLKGTIRWLRETFSPYSLTIEDMVADGDKVWARSVSRGTDSKGIMGHPPTGRSFTITVIDICRFENGKIVEHWGVPDRFHQLVQFGLIPQPQPQDHLAPQEIPDRP